MISQCLLFFCFALTLLFSTNTIAQDKEAAKTEAIAATVGNTTITIASVQRFIDKRFARKQLSDTAMAVARKHSLDHLVNRAIIRHYLKSKNRWVDPAVVRLETEKLESDLARADVTLKTHLAKKKISNEQFIFEMEWRLSWKKYLDDTLTQKRLSQYFESRKRDFDGTRMKVAHLLLKDDSDEAKAKLNELREQLVANPQSWNGVVEKHSQAASKNDGGLVGWIGIDGPMPPKFASAAFALNLNEISSPFQSKFGCHLIKCIEVKPGKKGPLDARKEVTASAEKFLFEKLARENRSLHKIEYSESNTTR